MDPVSIIASIAGIATAGAQLSSTLFRLIRTVRNAPREIQKIAIEMSGLTATLEHLRDIVKQGQSYTKPLFFEGVSNVIKNIQATQQEISKMVADQTIFARWKWLKAARFLSDIDKHKVTLTLQITVLSAAVLVKTNNGSSPVKEPADNRFRLQAESLIQIGQASLQRDSTQRQIPAPPSQRAPSPPVRTAKRLPSPVRQSEIPGHGRTDELYGQTLGVPKEQEDDENSAVVRCPTPPIRRVDKERQESSHDKDRGRTEGFDPLSGRVAQFGRHFHVHGDAATFLYKLVFMDEAPARNRMPGSRPYHDTDAENESVYSYDSDDSDNHERRARVHAYRKPEEPTKVVNHLLLTWTSLSQGEIESGSADGEQPSTKKPPPKVAYVEDASSSENEQENDGGETEDWASLGSRTEHRSEGRESPRLNISRQQRNFEFSQYSAPYESNAHDYRRPHFEPHHFDPGYQSDQDNYPYRSYPPTPLPTQEPAKPKFQKPHAVILPQADVADAEVNSTPELDVSPCLKMSIVRQGDEAIWNSDDFATQNSIPGKTIMGSLIGDKSARNPHGLDLAHTLIRGQDMKLVYIRGNDLGETWFINEQPVFLQFFHCGYLPQFYPANESDETAMKQEYVAVGEEWASFEALSQLGLSTKGREEGRVLLDPSTTWSMVKELAITTLQLRSMRQRRLYTSTFYNSISTFRQKHCGEVPEPLALKIDLATEPEPELRFANQKPDVLSFLVKDEDDAAETKAEKQETQHLRPQISITPPPSPQETSSPEFDKSDVGSTVSSRSRVSRFLKRCTPGRKQSQLSPPLQRYSSKNSETEPLKELSEDESKRPLTPTDSGIGSSVG